MPPETFVDAAVAQEDGQALARQRRVPPARPPLQSGPKRARTLSRMAGFSKICAALSPYRVAPESAARTSTRGGTSWPGGGGSTHPAALSAPSSAIVSACERIVLIVSSLSWWVRRKPPPPRRSRHGRRRRG